MALIKVIFAFSKLDYRARRRKKNVSNHILAKHKHGNNSKGANHFTLEPIYETNTVKNVVDRIRTIYKDPDIVRAKEQNA